MGNKTSMRLINAAWVQSYSRDVEHKGWGLAVIARLVIG